MRTVVDLDELTRLRFEGWATVSVSSRSVFQQLTKEEKTDRSCVDLKHGNSSLRCHTKRNWGLGG